MQKTLDLKCVYVCVYAHNMNIFLKSKFMMSKETMRKANRNKIYEYVITKPIILHSQYTLIYKMYAWKPLVPILHIASIKYCKNWEAIKAQTILFSVIWTSTSYEIFSILVYMPYTKLDRVEKALSYNFFNQFSAKL